MTSWFGRLVAALRGEQHVEVPGTSVRVVQSPVRKPPPRPPAPAPRPGIGIPTRTPPRSAPVVVTGPIRVEPVPRESGREPVHESSRDPDPASGAAIRVPRRGDRPEDRLPDYIKHGYLAEAEKVLWSERRHEVKLLEPLATTTAFLVLSIYWAIDIDAGSARLPFLAFGVALLRAIWCFVVWWHDWLIVTDERLLRVYGVFDQRAVSVPKSKISQRKLRRPIVGRLLDYGTILIDSVGNDHEMHQLDLVPEPLRADEVMHERVHRPPQRTAHGLRSRLEMRPAPPFLHRWVRRFRG